MIRGISRRRIAAYTLVAFFVVGVGFAAAAHIGGTSEINNGVPLSAPDGMTVIVEGNTQALLEDFTPTSGTVDVITEDGNVTFFSSGDAEATIHKDDITGTWTTVTAIDASSNAITINPEDKDSAIVGKAVSEFSWRSGIAVDDGTVDFIYTAPSDGRVTVQGVPANTRLAPVDSNTGLILDDATSNGGGSVTFDSLSSGTHSATIQTFGPDTPQLSNADPTGTQGIEPRDLSVDVSDGDFSRGDSVTVTIDFDGSQIHSETVSSDQTISTSVPDRGRTAGSYSWSVEASDSFGETATASYSYTVPENATFYPNASGETNTTGWVPGDGNTTAPGILEIISRIPGMFIGVGEEDPSGSGFEGLLLTALVIAAATLFATVGIDIGPVAGSMLGMVLAYGLTTVGLIPAWIQPLLLFTIVGVPASVAILRVFRR